MISATRWLRLADFLPKLAAIASALGPWLAIILFS
jgi:isopentenyldiphosphate isomerase